MNRFRKVSHPCLTTRGFTALRCPFGATLSLVRHGLASFDLQTFLRTKTVNKKVSTFKGALTRPVGILGERNAQHHAPSVRVARREKRLRPCVKNPGMLNSSYIIGKARP